MPLFSPPSPSSFLFLSFSFFILLQVHSRSPIHDRTSDAYVTLLYGDEFALGVRVLGKSLRDTGTRKDMVALVSDGVSDRVIDLLQADGWLIEKIDLLANPNNKRPKRFWGVYTKLNIFNMTNYRKVVYLDADTVVRKSIDDLFLCEKFCANLKHSERLNSGVMVVEPSQDVFKDMMAKVNTLPSYTGGDQGFLNSYYLGFPNAHLFDPNLSDEERKSRNKPTMERLSTLYNADVGLYMLANKWMVDETELRVIHYTLGPLKPWDWWTSWLLEPVRYWQDVRVTLEDSLPGTRGGQDPRIQFYVWVVATCPLLVLIFLSRNCLFQFHKYVQWNGSLVRFARHFLYKFKTGNTLPYYSHPNGSQAYISNIQHANGISGLTAIDAKLPACFGGLSVAACFVSAGVSFGVALFIIPNQVMPLTGLLLLYEWTIFLFGLLYCWYLHTMSTWGSVSGGSSLAISSSQFDNGKGIRHSVPWDGQILFLFTGMASLAILTPCLPLLFGVTSLFSRLGMVIGGGMALVAFMTYATQYLAIRWFLHGLEQANFGRLEVDPTRL